MILKASFNNVKIRDSRPYVLSVSVIWYNIETILVFLNRLLCYENRFQIPLMKRERKWREWVRRGSGKGIGHDWMWLFR